MKKLTALFTVVSFMMVSTAGAFANPRDDERNKVFEKRIERKQDRSPVVNRPAPDRRPVITRPAPDRKPIINRPNPDRKPVITRPAPNRKPVIVRPNRPNSNYMYNNMKNHNNFFSRVARNPYSRYHSNFRPAPNYRPHYSSSKNSMTPLEFLGIGAAIIALAAIVSNSSNSNNCYDY